MNRIKKLRKEKGMTLKELGNIVHLRDSTLSQYETGKRVPKLEISMKLANYFGVSLDYLLGVENDKYIENHGFDKFINRIAVPIDSIRIEKNKFTYDDETVIVLPVINNDLKDKSFNSKNNIIGNYPTALTEISNDSDTQNFWIKCNDNSMYPLIQNGSLALIHQQLTARDNDVVAVLIDEHIVLRRIKNISNQIILFADNREVEPITFENKDSEEILGKVIQIVTNM